ncbi:hypothetical protein JW962_01980 [Candidatus Dojkabacteria bacterium]|nr:hypothetical protein [Candidatus Dojkabacteria bacterium]
MKKLFTVLTTMGLLASLVFGTTKAASGDYTWGTGSIVISENGPALVNSNLQVAVSDTSNYEYYRQGDAIGYQKTGLNLGSKELIPGGQTEFYVYLRNAPDVTGEWQAPVEVATLISPIGAGEYAEHIHIRIEQTATTPGGFSQIIYEGALDDAVNTPKPKSYVGFSQYGDNTVEYKVTLSMIAINGIFPPTDTVVNYQIAFSSTNSAYNNSTPEITAQ